IWGGIECELICLSTGLVSECQLGLAGVGSLLTLGDAGGRSGLVSIGWLHSVVRSSGSEAVVQYFLIYRALRGLHWGCCLPAIVAQWGKSCRACASRATAKVLLHTPGPVWSPTRRAR